MPTITERDLGSVIPRARDFLTDFATKNIGPRLRDDYERLQAEYDTHTTDGGIVVAEKKKGDDIVSEVTKSDLTIDGQLRNAWQAIFGDSILWYSEESKAKVLKKMKAEDLKDVPLAIVVDPIDGSGRLARYSDRFSSSFALVTRGTTVLSVVYKPVGDTLWIAERDKQTIRIQNNQVKPIHVSKTNKLEKAYVSTAYAWNLKQRMRTMGIQLRLAPYVNQFASTASSVLDLVDVAQGHIDAMVAVGLFPWDMAGAGFAVTQNEGTVTTFQGNNRDWHPFQPQIIASNGLLHDELQTIVNRNIMLNGIFYMWQRASHREISRGDAKKHFWDAAKGVQETVVFLARGKGKSSQ